jgi:hypothetical protein
VGHFDLQPILEGENLKGENPRTYENSYKAEGEKMAKKGFWIGMLIMVLTFGMTVIGCDTGNEDAGFVPVTNITDLPKIALKGAGLSLSGTVVPSNATNQSITWSGDEVTDGVFNSTSEGEKTVIATITNGESESTPYTKQFTITVYDTTANQIGLSQGTWTRNAERGQPDQLIVTNSSWMMKQYYGIMIEVANGIIIQLDGNNYVVQINKTLSPQGTWINRYQVDTGTYTFAESDTKLTISSVTPSYPINGTWEKQ